MAVFRMKNTIQDYDWGTTYFIPELVKYDNRNSKPCAELWMGAHPKAPSQISVNDNELALNSFIDSSPELILGSHAVSVYDKKLPFLFKVLSASKALSIQAHPNKLQAMTGFNRENELGIELTDRNRNYKDNNHKPELMLALTPFTAMCGFRAIAEIEFLFELLEISELFPGIKKGYREFFSDYLRLDDSFINEMLLDRIKAKLSSSIQANKILTWCLKLHEQFGNHIGILAPLFLNIIKLNPGEAIYLEAGILHAYLEGSGLEIMANSDNVLRAGLTSKHIDKEEIFNVLRFEHTPIALVDPCLSENGEIVYQTGANEFEISKLEINNKTVTASCSSAEILLCTSGKCSVNGVELIQGQTVFVTAEESEINITGEGTIFRAKTPLI